ncbi:MAG: phosphoribosyltransferase [Candidatus Thorarchaeota archaeon]
MHAGKLLAKKLKVSSLSLKDSIILAIPRGGVPVAYEIAQKLNIPFSLVITKKLAPLSNPEFAFGAIAPDGTTLINQQYLSYHRINNEELTQIKKNVLTQIKNRIHKYQIDEKIDLKSKNSIIVDDGIATGYTAMVAGKYIKKKGSRKTILAIPVAPKNSIKRAKNIFDSVICYLPIDAMSFAVGAYYNDFHQVQDEELFNYMDKAKKQNLIYEKIKETPSAI